MPFNRPSINTIYSRIKSDMESRLTGDVEIPAFSVLDILARIFAAAIHLCYGTLSWLADQLFPDTAEQDYLDRQANIYGLSRVAATFATGTITVTGDETTVIPIGTIFKSLENIEYRTTEAGLIASGTDTIAAQSSLAGTIGNLAISSELTLVSTVSGLDTTATTATAFEGGFEQETDEALRQRLLIYLSSPPAGGRDQDYKLWAFETAGVAYVWVFGSYLGAGTVGVVIADSDFQVLPTITKDSVQSTFNEKGPLGVQKTALDPVPKTVDIDISITPNTSTFQDAIQNNIEELFIDVTAPGGTILLSQLRNAIANSGVSDYEITDIEYDSVSIGVVNIVASNFDLPYVNTLTFSAL